MVRYDIETRQNYTLDITNMTLIPRMLLWLVSKYNMFSYLFVYFCSLKRDTAIVNGAWREHVLPNSARDHWVLFPVI